MYGETAEYILSREDEALLERAGNLWGFHGLWRFHPADRMAALVDLHAGHFPHVCQPNEELSLLWSRKLVEYCESEKMTFPYEMRSDNAVLSQYRDTRQERAEAEIIYIMAEESPLFAGQMTMYGSSTKRDERADSAADEERDKKIRKNDVGRRFSL